MTRRSGTTAPLPAFTVTGMDDLHPLQATRVRIYTPPILREPITLTEAVTIPAIVNAIKYVERREFYRANIEAIAPPLDTNKIESDPTQLIFLAARMAQETKKARNVGVLWIPELADMQLAIRCVGTLCLMAYMTLQRRDEDETMLDIAQHLTSQYLDDMSFALRIATAPPDEQDYTSAREHATRFELALHRMIGTAQDLLTWLRARELPMLTLRTGLSNDDHPHQWAKDLLTQATQTLLQGLETTFVTPA